VHPCSTVSLQCWAEPPQIDEVEKTVKLFLTSLGQHNDPIEMKFGMCAYNLGLLELAIFGPDRSRDVGIRARNTPILENW